MINLGLTPGVHGYLNGEFWATTTSNWNIVTNVGLSMGALAVGDEAPELAEYILQQAINNLPIALSEYAPDGGYPEGVGYWAYATQYLAPFVSSLQTAVGTDHGFTEIPGLSETGYFPIYMTGPTNQFFNFADSPSTGEPWAEMFWLGNT